MAGPMEPLTSTQAQQPSSLSSPVPSKELPDLSALANALPDMPAPSTQLPEGELPDLGQLLNQASPMGGSMSPELPEGMTLSEDNRIIPFGDSPLAEPAAFSLESANEQMREWSTRFRNAWTMSDKESMQVLRESGIFEDVRLKNGKFEVKRPGRKGWEKMDREGYQLMSDTIDATRMAFEGIIENIGRIGGGVMGGKIGGALGKAVGGIKGAIAGAPLGPAGVAMGGEFGAMTGEGMGAAGGAAIGTVKGGAYGGMAATNIADQVAEQLVGITRDPNRSHAAETAIAAAYGAAFNKFGGSVAAKRALNKFGRVEGKNYVESMTTLSDEAQSMVKEVMDSGILLSKDGKQFKLDPQQLTQGQVAEINAMAAQLSKQPAFRNFRNAQGEILKDAYQSIINAYGSKARGGGNIGEEFVLNFNHMKNAEGSLLGSVRVQGKQLAQGRRLPMEQTKKFVDGLFTKYGGTSEPSQVASSLLDEYGRPIMQQGEDVLKAPDYRLILRQNAGLTEAQAKSLSAELLDLQKRFKGGKMTLEKTEALYDNLTTKINNAFSNPNSRSYAFELIEIKNALRDEWTDNLGKVIQKEGGNIEGYVTARNNYSNFKIAETNLTSLLKTENISRDALIKKMFQGTNSYNFAKSAETIFKEHDPKFWQDITSEYLHRLFTENTDAAGKVNWAAIQKQWGTESAKSGIGKEMREVIANGAGINKKQFDTLLNIGRIYHATDFAPLPQEQKVHIAKKIFMALNPFAGNTARSSSAADIASEAISNVGEGKAMMNWLDDGGLDEVMKSMTHLNQAQKNGLRFFYENDVKRAMGIPVIAIPARTTGRMQTIEGANEMFNMNTPVENQQ